MPWTTELNGLTKEFTLRSFIGAVDFVNRIVPLAQEMDHHPDLFIHSYKKVKVILFTHSEKKITDKDRELAQKIDALGES